MRKLNLKTLNNKWTTLLDKNMMKRLYNEEMICGVQKRWLSYWSIEKKDSLTGKNNQIINKSAKNWLGVVRLKQVNYCIEYRDDNKII